MISWRMKGLPVMDGLPDLADLGAWHVDFALSPFIPVEAVKIRAVLGTASGAPAPRFAAADRLWVDASRAGANRLFGL